MTITHAQPPRFQTRFQRFFVATTAIFLASSMASMALTTAEKEIERYLSQLTPPVTFDAAITSADPTNFVTAALKAITTPLIKTNINPSDVVKAALKRKPAFASAYAKAALDKVYNGVGGFPPQFTGTPASINSKRASQATIIVTEAFKSGLTSGLDPALRANLASAITASSVNTVKTLPSIDPANTRVLTPLQVVIKAAVKASLVTKVGGVNGLNGVMTGAISQVAGVDNEILGVVGVNNGAAPDADDNLVASVLKTAVQNAASRVFDIAEAASYAFASTYRATTGSDVGLDQFLTNNQQALLKALLAGLPATKQSTTTSAGKIILANQILQSRVLNSIRIGIALAYSGIENIEGSRGVNEFAYNNGQGPEVTNTTGF